MTDTPPHATRTTPQTPSTPINRPALIFNWMDWLPYFDHSDAPIEQKRIWIETLWLTVSCFADLGFDIKSSSESCGEEIDLKAVLEAAVVSSSHASPHSSDQPSPEEDTA